MLTSEKQKKENFFLVDCIKKLHLSTALNYAPDFIVIKFTIFTQI